MKKHGYYLLIIGFILIMISGIIDFLVTNKHKVSSSNTSKAIINNNYGMFNDKLKNLMLDEEVSIDDFDQMKKLYVILNNQCRNIQLSDTNSYNKCLVIKSNYEQVKTKIESKMLPNG